MKLAVFFITGTSGSGKSTLVKILRRELSSAEVYDFDEGGVPEGADKKWRKERIDMWLKKAKDHHQKGKSTVICGVSVPEEVKNSPNYNKSLNVHYGFIHISEKEIRQRLKTRGWKKELIDGNVNWAKHLEKYVKATKNHYIVDGVKHNPEQVAKKFIKWIRQETVNYKKNNIYIE